MKTIPGAVVQFFFLPPLALESVNSQGTLRLLLLFFNKKKIKQQK